MRQEAHSDPLADGPPPRYAVESDDEDEYSPSPRLPSGSEQLHREAKVEFKAIYDIPRNRPLVFASGEAGMNWARTVNLGEQQGGIYVDDHPVGLLFLPSWTSGVIVVSEAGTQTRLPLFAMTTYTTAIVSRLQPTSVAILDSYAIKVYISPRVISQDNAPTRYLSIGEKPVTDDELELFAPPNLLQSTAASLLNQLFLRSTGQGSAQHSVAVILLPSHRVPPPPPTSFNSSSSAGGSADTDWGRNTLERAHRWLFAIVGEDVDASSLGADAEPATRPPVSVGITRPALWEVGEGSMYI